MKHVIVILALAGVIMTSSCNTFRPAAPKPITFECALSKEEFMKITRHNLEINRYSIDVFDEEKGEIEAGRVPRYTGIGENLIVKGPYVFYATYIGGKVTIIVQTVHERDGKAVAVESHDESSEIGDKRNFMPVVEAVRKACGK